MKPNPSLQTAFSISYQGDRVILCGAADAIHSEARRILNRFASSGRPLRIKNHGPDCIILSSNL